MASTNSKSPFNDSTMKINKDLSDSDSPVLNKNKRKKLYKNVFQDDDESE